MKREDQTPSATARSGIRHRINPERYFHVMGQGWYALLREGIAGPFTEKNSAMNYVYKVVNESARPR